MQYDFNLSAGGGQTIDVRGSFFKYKSGLGLLRMKTNRGGSIDLMPGESVYDVDFESLTVQDKSGAANAGVLLIGKYDFRSDNLSGTVSLTDGGKAATMAETCFIGTQKSGTVAASYNAVNLHNPAASGVNVILESVELINPSGAIFTACMYDNAFVPPFSAVAYGAMNKKTGRPDAKANLTAENSAALNVFYSRIITRVPAAGSKIVFEEPIILTPGRGLGFYVPVLAAELWVTYEFREDPI